nr:hypothetical protein [Tanacetum cinerariifolium]
TMADMNIPANDVPAKQDPAITPPTRTNDQILPSRKRVHIGKSNCVLDIQNYQLDEQWFNLHKDILRDALDITPTNDNNPYVPPPSSDMVIKYAKTSCALDSLRKNLATASHEKKKTTHLLIPNVRFVGTDGREIFGMPLPDALLTDEIKGAPNYAKRSKGELLEKIRKPRSPLKLVDEPNAKDVPVEESSYNKEEANLQRALELSLKEQAERTQGPARPVAGPNPSIQDKGQAGSNPGDAAESQP